MTAIGATRAVGLLAAFGEAGVLAAADVHVATRLGVLTGETDDRVLLGNVDEANPFSPRQRPIKCWSSEAKSCSIPQLLPSLRHGPRELQTLRGPEMNRTGKP